MPLIANAPTEFNINNLVKALALTVLIISTNGCTTLHMEFKNKHKIELEVLEEFKGLAEAVESLDADRYFEYFDKEKFTGLNADGTVWHSMDKLEALISSGFPMVEKNLSLEFNKVKVTAINPTTVILVNEYKQSLLLKNGNVIEQAGGGTQVWSKFNGAWKLVSASASEVSH